MFPANQIVLLGFRTLDLDHAISPNANPADYETISQYIQWGSMVLSGDSLYGGGFDKLDYNTQLRVIECLNILIKGEAGPTLMPSLIDMSPVIDEMLSKIDPDTRMVMSRGSTDYQSTEAIFKSLESMGRMDVIFDTEFGAYNAVDMIRQVDTEANSGSQYSSLSDVCSLKTLDRCLRDAVNTPVVRYTPRLASTSVSPTGIAGWPKS